MDPGSHVPDPMMAGEFCPPPSPVPPSGFPLDLCLFPFHRSDRVHLACFLYFLFLKPGSLLEFVPALVIIVVVVLPPF